MSNETPITIPFNRPSPMGRESELLMDSVKRSQLAGDGYYTRLCHGLLERELGVSKVLLTTSCTHALEMSAILLDFRPGDEVIVPSFTFVSTPNAFVLRGAKPVFIDIRPDTLNLDETKLEELITPRTKAIVPVHYGGVGCAMDTIMDVAKRKGVPVVEDNAHGLFGKYRGKNLGTFGTFGTQSFHETKNFTCGEGGALLINDPAYSERAEILREKGTNRSKFSAVRWTNIPGWTWVQAICRRTSLRPFCTRSLRSGIASRHSASISGNSTTGIYIPGPPATMSGCRLSLLIATSHTICTISCSRRSIGGRP
jgi:dTDP-4-amino-4,6-dideoxygalactose transaminase